MDSYTSIQAPAQGLFKDKGSRFIAYAYPVSSEAEIGDLLKALESEHHAARHICYAYRLPCTEGEGKWRANDNGEPSGTAGRPILGQIDSLGLSGVMVAVVRYFGGILLGVSGLRNAYKCAAADALANATLAPKTITCLRLIECQYEHQPAVEEYLKTQSIRVVKRDFAETCQFLVEIPAGLCEQMAEQTKNLVIFKD